jgi:hypothetical protein
MDLVVSWVKNVRSGRGHRWETDTSAEGHQLLMIRSRAHLDIQILG